ncbi:MAG TPA: hypothetical protein VM888_06130 [Chitinophagaceae bacterium]|nr:hypothetical protein [Chitinophagaceae bacterium]
MKRRLHQMLNFFAFNLLFFAIFLNFIHKDKDAAENFIQKNTSTATATLVKKDAGLNQKDNQEIIKSSNN